MTDLYRAAMKYIAAGLAVIPLWRDKRKNPHLTSTLEYTHRLPEAAEWNKWSKRWPGANVGLITGYWRNLVALDFDDEPAFNAWLESVDGWYVGRTWQVATRRGYHVWFQLAADPGHSRNYVLDGHEVLLRARGGYCIVPPSIHHTGAPYRTVHKVTPLQVEDLESILPGWIEKVVRKERNQTMLSEPAAGGLRIEHIVEPVGKPNGRGAYKAFCPFHDDKNPSAWVNPGQGRFGCNACWPGQWWDVVNVYAMLKNISNGQAYHLLKTE